MTRKFQSSKEDKLELLFRKQLELTRKMRNVDNKMSSIYKKKEVFRGYRVFMLSTALIHEAIELPTRAHRHLAFCYSIIYRTEVRSVWSDRKVYDKT